MKLFKIREKGCLGGFPSSQNGHKMGSMGSQEVFPGAFCIKTSDLIDRQPQTYMNLAKNNKNQPKKQIQTLTKFGPKY